MSSPGMVADAYAADLDLSPGETLELLEELAREGFLEREGELWRIR